MKKTFLTLFALLLFLSLPHFLGAIENDNSVNDKDIPGRPAYVGFPSGEKRNQPFSHDNLITNYYYQIGGIWYKFKGYNALLKGFDFYKNDDEQVILNKNKDKKWFVTKECKGNNCFQPVGEDVLDAHYSDSDIDLDTDEGGTHFYPCSNRPSFRRYFLRCVGRYATKWAFTLGVVLFLKWHFERKRQKNKIPALPAAQEALYLNNEAIVS